MRTEASARGAGIPRDREQLCMKRSRLARAAALVLSVFAAACAAHRSGEPRPGTGTATATATATPAGATAPATPAPIPQDVAYQLSPVLSAAGELTALAVEMKLRGDADGSTRLRLPERWAAAAELWRNVSELQIQGAYDVTDDGPAVRVIQAAPNAPLTVRYRVVSGYAGAPKSTVGQPFLPIVRPGWFYAFGHALFAEIEGRQAQPVRFAWSAPAGFPFASDLQHLQAQPAATLEGLLDSIAVGGREVTVHTLGEGALRLGVAGRYGFSHGDFLSLAESVLSAQRTFFAEGKARPEDRFVIALSPLERVAGHSSIGGSGVGDAFALSISEDTQLEALRPLLSHEYFHTWNPRRLGGPDTAETEYSGKWFSEGFTDFYTQRLLMRTGRYTLEDFITAWNQTLLAYATSPVRTAPNQRIVADYWRDPAVNKLPYHRGQLLAALWDHQLRQATGGAKDLDDALLAMKARVDAAPAAARAAMPPAAALFASAYRAAGGPDLGEDLARFVERGEAIELPEDAFGGCVEVKARPLIDAERKAAPAAASVQPAPTVQYLELPRVLPTAARDACIASLGGLPR